MRNWDVERWHLSKQKYRKSLILADRKIGPNGAESSIDFAKPVGWQRRRRQARGTRRTTYAYRWDLQRLSWKTWCCKKIFWRSSCGLAKCNFWACKIQSEKGQDSFITDLHDLAEYCEYGTLGEEMIRDRIVVELLDAKPAERLQVQTDLTLVKTGNEARQSEQVKK